MHDLLHELQVDEMKRYLFIVRVNNKYRRKAIFSVAKSILSPMTCRFPPPLFTFFEREGIEKKTALNFNPCSRLLPLFLPSTPYLTSALWCSIGLERTTKRTFLLINTEKKSDKQRKESAKRQGCTLATELIQSDKARYVVVVASIVSLPFVYKWPRPLGAFSLFIFFLVWLLCSSLSSCRRCVINTLK